MPKVNVKPKDSGTGSPHWSPKCSPSKHGVHKESRLSDLGTVGLLNSIQNKKQELFPNAKKIHAGKCWCNRAHYINTFNN